MATSRRRRGGFRRMRPKLDWVTNRESYGNEVLTWTAGQAGQFALPLTYSARALEQITGLDAAQQIIQSGTAVPHSSRGLVVRAVHWYAVAEPATWVLGNVMVGSMRLTVQDQDQENGAASVVAGYTAWIGGSTGAVLDQAAYFADERFLTEQRRVNYFGDASTRPMLVFSGKWSGRRTIPPQQALFAIFESPSNSVTMRLRYKYFRTLLEVPK